MSEIIEYSESEKIYTRALLNGPKLILVTRDTQIFAECLGVNIENGKYDIRYLDGKKVCLELDRILQDFTIGDIVKALHNRNR